VGSVVFSHIGPVFDMREQFEKVIRYCKSADTASLFSPEWKKAAEAAMEQETLS
jgi:hypothetical protein